MQRDQEIINRWKSSAPFWEKHRDVIRGMFAPVTQALIEDAEIGSEDSVLDVATGPGEPALSVAALVGPKGKVFGVDPIQGMVAAARSVVVRLGLKNAKFDVAFADDLPFCRRYFRCGDQPVWGDVLSLSDGWGARDVASAQARTEVGLGGLALRGKESFSLRVVAGC